MKDPGLIESWGIHCASGTEHEQKHTAGVGADLCKLSSLAVLASLLFSGACHPVSGHVVHFSDAFFLDLLKGRSEERTSECSQGSLPAFFCGPLSFLSLRSQLGNGL